MTALAGSLNGPTTLAVVLPKPALRGCMAWRVWQPFAALRRAGYPAHWTGILDPDLDEKCAEAGVVVLPKLGFVPEHRSQALRWRDQVHREGGVLVYETDDDVFTEHLQHLLAALHGYNAEETARQREAYIWTLRLCDGATVTGSHLREAARRYTDKPVEIVPNAIDLDWFRAVQAKAPRAVSGLTVGWFGGARAESDLAVMAEAWRRVARRYPRVRFVAAGWRPDVLAEAVGSRLSVLPWRDVTEYPRSLVNVDIGCCPLPDTPFNRCKSPIKALEFGASGAAVVASPLLYSEAEGGPIRHGETGYIAHDADEWERAISRLVESRARRRDLARALGERVARVHSLGANLHRWPAAWRAIRESRTQGDREREWKPRSHSAASSTPSRICRHD